MKIIPMSIVIPTYNRTKVLFDTIESLNAGEYVPDEVIVVDQTNPPVEFPEKLKAQMGERLVVINESIPSLTRSRNIGLKAAGNDIVLFCDDDILVNSDSLKELYDAINNNEVALAAGIHKGENLLYEGKKAIWFGLLVERCSECRSSGARTVMLFMEVCVDVMRLTSPRLCQQNGQWGTFFV